MAVMGADKGTYAHNRKPEPAKTPSLKPAAKNEPFNSVSNGTNALAPAKDYSKAGR